MPKKTPKLKLTQIEQERLEGALAKVEVAQLHLSARRSALDALVAEIAGAGYELEQKQDGIYRKPKE